MNLIANCAILIFFTQFALLYYYLYLIMFNYIDLIKTKNWLLFSMYIIFTANNIYC